MRVAEPVANWLRAGLGARRVAQEHCPGSTAVLALAALCHAALSFGTPPPNVLLVVLDTTRVDAVSRSTSPDSPTPRFARLAGSGVTFSNARSTAPWTLPSHGSLFTGLYPSRHGAHHEHQMLDPERVTLAELLAPTHETAAFSENPHIVRAKGFAQGFTTFEEAWRPPPEGQRIVSTDSRVVDWLGHRDWSRPFFLFVNLMAAHLPYAPPEGTEKRFLPAGTSAEQVHRMRQVTEREARLAIMGKLVLSPSDLAVLRALYRAEVAHAGSQLGRIVDAIKARGALDRTLVVIIADHGENIGEHKLMEHQLCVYETLLRVPILLRLAGTFDDGSVRNGPVQLVDILPTVLDVVGLPAGQRPPVEGHSLVRWEPPADRPLIAEYMRPVMQRPRFEELDPSFDFGRFDRRLKSMQVGSMKIIVSSRGDTELYDLAADPGETTNLADARPELTRTLASQLAAWSARAAPVQGAASTLPELDQETLRALRSLGYLR
jgi:arylsulfatase A-like enzyme